MTTMDFSMTVYRPGKSQTTYLNKSSVHTSSRINRLLADDVINIVAEFVESSEFGDVLEVENKIGRKVVFKRLS